MFAPNWMRERMSVSMWFYRPIFLRAGDTARFAQLLSPN
jgi:hypothetical protein